MPVGLVFSNNVAASPVGGLGDPNARTFMAGITERGPVVATPVNSLASYIAQFGVRQSWCGAMYDAAQCFFNEGGTDLYVARVVGAGATPATLVLVDRAGTPLPTITINAENKGSYGSEITVAVTAGVPSGVTITIYDNGVQVDQFLNLPDPATIATAVSNSIWVNAVNMGSASVGVLALPALMAATPLAGGNDQRAAVVAATIVSGFAAFGADLGPGAVMAPGYAADLVGTGLVAHCIAVNTRIALLSGPPDNNLPGMKALVATIQTAYPKQSDYAGLFGPWVLINDGSAVRAIEPTAYVAGVRAKAINANGFQQSPAGTISNATWVIGLATPLDSVANNAYNDAQINGITQYRGAVRLYGWRSLSTDLVNYWDLTNRSIANAIQDLVIQAADPFVFDTIDGTGVLFAALSGAILGLLGNAALNNAFYPMFLPDGTQSDPGYTVAVSLAGQTVANYPNTIVVTVGFRPSPTADLIKVNITLAGLGVAL